MTLREKLEEIFQTTFNDDSIVLRDNTTAADIPAWDSLAHINLMFSIEEAFGVRFTDDQLTDFENVAELESFLASRSQV